MIWAAVSRDWPTTAMLSTMGGWSSWASSAAGPPKQEGHGGDDGEKTLHPHSVGGGCAGSGGAGAAA